MAGARGIIFVLREGRRGPMIYRDFYTRGKCLDGYRLTRHFVCNGKVQSYITRGFVSVYIGREGGRGIFKIVKSFAA